jgi:hypothetical protein
MKIRKSRTKKLYNIGPWAVVTKSMQSLQTTEVSSLNI